MNAIVFAGTNGLSTIAGAISQHHLTDVGHQAKLVNDFNLTGMPGTFWGKTFPAADLEGYELVLIVNIPLPPVGLSEAALAKIREATGSGTTQVVLLDYPRLDCVPYAAAIEAGAEVRVSSVPAHLYWGDPTPYSCQLGRIASIANMDPSTLPVSDDEMRVVRGLDIAIRDNRPAALDALQRGDLEWFARQSRELPTPPEGVQVAGNAVYLPRLTQGLGFKQLQVAAEDAGLPFGVGEDHQNGFRLLIANNWRLPELPVALRINLVDFKGNGNAVVREVAPVGDPEGAEKTRKEAQRILALLNDRSSPETETGAVSSNGGPSGALGTLSKFVRQFMDRVKHGIPVYMPEHCWPHLNRVLGQRTDAGRSSGLGRSWSAAVGLGWTPPRRRQRSRGTACRGSD